MADQIGIVLNSNGDGWARVATDRKGACGGCQSAGSACRSCLTSAKQESRVINPLNAEAGDIVKITLPSAVLFKGAAIMYLLPIAALILGAFVTMWLGSLLGWSDTVGAVAGAAGGLGVGLWAVVRLGRSPGMSRQMTPTITAIVPAPNSPAKQSPASCCG
jgi:sigma-E factor negative regulatory protein RseC